MMNTDAPEFVSSRNSVDNRIFREINDIVVKCFCGSSFKGSQDLLRVAMLCNENRLNFVDCVARSILRNSLSETGKASVGWNMLTELFTMLDDVSRISTYGAILQSVYFVVHDDVLESQLRSTAKGIRADALSSSVKGISEMNLNGDSNDPDFVDKLPIKINELLHFLKLILTEEMHPSISERNGKNPPLQTLVDFCFLVNKIFEFQMKSVTYQKELSTQLENEGKREVWERTRTLRSWFEIVSVLCENCIRVIPMISNILSASDEALDSHGWLPSADHQIRNSIVNAQLNESGIYSPASLNTFYEALLTRLKVLCIDEGLPSNVRSIAVDTLLSAAMQPAVCKYVNNNPYETSDLEGLDDNVRDDYEKFLLMSGQCQS